MCVNGVFFEYFIVSYTDYNLQSQLIIKSELCLYEKKNVCFVFLELHWSDKEVYGMIMKFISLTIFKCNYKRKEKLLKEAF